MIDEHRDWIHDGGRIMIKGKQHGILKSLIEFFEGLGRNRHYVNNSGSMEHTQCLRGRSDNKKGRLFSFAPFPLTITVSS